MNLYLSFIIQLFIFFLIVTSIAGVFTKNQAKRPAGKKKLSPDSVEKFPSEDVEDTEFKRNAKKQDTQTTRPTRSQRERREKYQRYQRNNNSEKVMKEVVNLSTTVQKKKKGTGAVSFNKKNLKQAIIYKEILDKPLSIRESNE